LVSHSDFLPIYVAPALKRSEPFDELTAFPNRIYPNVKIFFDRCTNFHCGRRAINPAIGLNCTSGKSLLRSRRW
jgi:hypothetical protein